jgi:hypothetical protein
MGLKETIKRLEDAALRREAARFIKEFPLRFDVAQLSDDERSGIQTYVRRSKRGEPFPQELAAALVRVQR